MAKREKESYVIRSVTNALNLLEEFKGDRDELGVTELSYRLNLHKNKVFRLLATLETKGYIEQNKATENYRLSLKSLELGQTFINQAVKVTNNIGLRLPIHCTAIGKAQIAYSTEEELEKLGILDNMEQFTPNTIVNKVEFIKEIKEVARRGYALDNEEYNPGVKCVAVPIRDYTGRVVGGISVPGPSFRMTDEILKGEIIPVLKAAGEKASKRLGFGA